MHAFLVKQNETSQSLAAEIAKKHEAKILPFVLQKIEDVRNLRRLTSLSFSQKTAILIENIDAASIEAQNAFLKSLEEPQKNILYIISSDNIQAVIPTIVSRCEIVRAYKDKNTNKESEDYTRVDDFLNSDVNRKLEFVSKIKDRGEAINFINNLIKKERQNQNYECMEIYLNVFKNLKANGNIALQLTNLVVKMNSHGR